MYIPIFIKIHNFRTVLQTVKDIILQIKLQFAIWTLLSLSSSLSSVTIYFCKLKAPFCGFAFNRCRPPFKLNLNMCKLFLILMSFDTTWWLQCCSDCHWKYFFSCFHSSLNKSRKPWKIIWVSTHCKFLSKWLWMEKKVDSQFQKGISRLRFDFFKKAKF